MQADIAPSALTQPLPRNPALGKRRTKHTYSRMCKATENKAVWNWNMSLQHPTDLCQGFCADGESAVGDLNGTDQSEQQLACLLPLWQPCSQKWITSREPGCKVLTHHLYLRNRHQPAVATEDGETKVPHRNVSNYMQKFTFLEKNGSSENNSLWCL